jgi:hypothetical protein
MLTWAALLRPAKVCNVISEIQSKDTQLVPFAYRFFLNSGGLPVEFQLKKRTSVAAIQQNEKIYFVAQLLLYQGSVTASQQWF